ncbi:hypothetical protein VXS85_13655, partial [Escherichia coli]|nr:hypothetical protein [Escherichia coli]
MMKFKKCLLPVAMLASFTLAGWVMTPT